MPELDDIALLRQYAEDNSESAFAALAEKYVNLVYSTALRSELLSRNQRPCSHQ